MSGLTDQGIASSAYFSSPAGGYFSNGSKTSFAWALMAGLDFNISPNLRLEMGYRYLNYGSIGTGGSNCLAGAGGGTFSAQNCSGGVPNRLYIAQYAGFERYPHRPDLAAGRAGCGACADRHPLLRR